ncbi:protein involved in gliding motility GldE [Psychroflexus salarius]|uniref:Protein involved in gliding motility GldE n=1 Tax=Psychroflexus salarius TaxID=1155689 RepID=A0A1M4UR90_9FLAO|nr:gliding motility-associated protein GldE [Psychroflexus salarius]SHE59205.1 protein involved in gliding motility GldE [Psychroflexus salarius]
MEPEPSSLFLLVSLPTAEIIKLVILVILLLCSALISGSEVALFSLKPTDFDTDHSSLTPKDHILIRLLDRPKKLLATILIANNFINIAIVLIYSSVSDYFFQGTNIYWSGLSLKLLIDIGLVTFLILLFGEILPKVYANRNSVEFAQFMAIPLGFLDKFFSPLSLPMRAVTISIHNKFGKQKSNLSIDQLSQALELTHEAETTTDEKKILKGIVSFGNTDVKQVMKPRLDMFALETTTKFNEVLIQIVEEGYSRIPVYEENVDNIIGILYVKDLLPYRDLNKFEWQNLLREPYFVPENKKLDDLLNDFKSQKNHLAIVVDEYGGTSGLISLEDIIEEIVGDISDEYDDEDLIFSKIDEHTFIFEGKTALKDFYRIFELEEEEQEQFENDKGESETLAGFVLEISKSLPIKNQIISYLSYKFTIEVVDNKRIKQIKVKKHASNS